MEDDKRRGRRPQRERPEFVPEIDVKPVVEKGTCDTCKNIKFYVLTADSRRGLCEIGNILRGHTQIPPENTCDHWEASDGSLAKV